MEMVESTEKKLTTENTEGTEILKKFSVLSVFSVVNSFFVCSILSTLFLLLSPTKCFSDPWGKDADLVHKREQCTPQSRKYKTPIFGPLSEVLIRFHQEVISPADGPRSYHKPSSSQYTLDAIRKYGFFRGFLMGCDRLMRENDDPWIYPIVKDAAGDTFKWDPVK